MRLDELPKSDNIEDRRGGSSGFPGGRGGIGIGTIVVLGLIGWALGIDPRVLIGGAEMMSRDNQTQQQSDAGSTTSAGAPSDAMGEFVSKVLGSTEAQWKDIFAQAGKTYTPPTLVMFSGATRSGCGAARAAMGPFYCPLDQKVYLDTSFFQGPRAAVRRLRCRQQHLPVFPSLCDRPRNWPPRAEPAGVAAAGTRGPARDG